MGKLASLLSILFAFPLESWLITFSFCVIARITRTSSPAVTRPGAKNKFFQNRILSGKNINA
jgi:hypothetical protein